MSKIPRYNIINLAQHPNDNLVLVEDVIKLLKQSISDCYKNVNDDIVIRETRVESFQQILKALE